jgi:hypothetical protein
MSHYFKSGTGQESSSLQHRNAPSYGFDALLDVLQPHLYGAAYF